MLGGQLKYRLKTPFFAMQMDEKSIFHFNRTYNGNLCDSMLRFLSFLWKTEIFQQVLFFVQKLHDTSYNVIFTVKIYKKQVLFWYIFLSLFWEKDLLFPVLSCIIWLSIQSVTNVDENDHIVWRQLCISFANPWRLSWC